MQKEISTGSTKIVVDIADTDVLREQGLSGRKSLKDGSGMLFIFENDGLHGIWMKDMLFNIDILWLDDNGLVVTMAPNVSPDTYPQVFKPKAEARYVLEVPTGFTKKAGIVEGTKFVL